MRSTLIILTSVFFILTGCDKKNNQPKPRGFLALNYQKANYKKLEDDCSFAFKINQSVEKHRVKPNSCDYKFTYPDQEASVFLSYRPVKSNLEKLLVDAQKIPTKHQIKADAISVEVFENLEQRVFGNFYKVKGDAASQAQFYVTDSTNHFITASLYFDAVPNYDSVYPASEYIINDMKKMMESMRWK